MKIEIITNYTLSVDGLIYKQNDKIKKIEYLKDNKTETLEKVYIEEIEPEVLSLFDYRNNYYKIAIKDIKNIESDIFDKNY